MTNQAIESRSSAANAYVDEGRRRRELTGSLHAAVAGGHETAGYDGWYRASLAESLLQRALVIEHQEWRRHVEDLVRDALPETGETADWWDEVSAGAENSRFSRRRSAMRPGRRGQHSSSACRSTSARSTSSVRATAAAAWK